VQSDNQTIQLGYTHGLRDGQTVVYDAGGGTAIGGLTSCDSYVVHVVSPTAVRLSPVGGGAIITLVKGAATGQSHRLVDGRAAGLPASESPYFDPKAAGAVSGTTITLPYTLTPALQSGDSVIYSSGGGAPIGGLVDGGSYYVKVTGSGIQLTTQKCLTESSVPAGCTGTFIALDAAVSSGRGHSIVKQGAQPSPDPAATSGCAPSRPTRTTTSWASRSPRPRATTSPASASAPRSPVPRASGWVAVSTSSPTARSRSSGASRRSPPDPPGTPRRSSSRRATS